MNPIVVMLVSVVFGFAAQMNLKTGVTRMGGVNFAGTSAGRDLLRLLVNPNLMGAIFLYFLSFMLYLKAISGDGGLPISVAYPMASLNLVLITVAARAFFGEQVSPLRWGGVALVLAGVILIGLSAPGEQAAKRERMAQVPMTAER